MATRTSDPAPTRGAIAAVHDALQKAYGAPDRRPRSRPLDGLIRTMLSQNTTSVNAQTAFEEFKRRFPTWQACLDADVADVADAIRFAGLSRVRAPRIQAILGAVQDDVGDFDIDFVCTMSATQALAYLQRFPGVGPKTASCVLLFSCGKQIFPVDTHIDRIAKRLGWIADGTPPEAIQTELEPLIAGPSRYGLHLNLILHGRTVCKARRPQCQGCALLRFCPSGFAVTSGLTEEV